MSASHIVDVEVKTVSQPGVGRTFIATATYHGLTWKRAALTSDQAEKAVLKDVETGKWCGVPMEKVDGYVP